MGEIGGSELWGRGRDENWESSTDRIYYREN